MLQEKLDDVIAILKTGRYTFDMPCSLYRELEEEGDYVSGQELVEIGFASHVRVTYEKPSLDETGTNQVKEKMLTSLELVTFVQLLNFMRLDSSKENAAIIREFLDKHKARWLIKGSFWLFFLCLFLLCATSN